MNQDTRDFLLHLYDKLWENMAAKEGRLWNYLSVYGAAIALAIGVGQYSGTQLYAVLIVLALTVWAVLIVVNANWWYQRNRLMVTQIEKRFSKEGSLDGVVPRAYRNAVYQFDRLYRGSVLILSTIALLLYAKTVFEFRIAGSFKSAIEPSTVLLVHAFFVLSVAYCSDQHESYISSYYESKRDLLRESGELSEDALAKQVANERSKGISSYSWMKGGVLLLILLFVLTDAFLAQSTFGLNFPTIVALFFQVGAVASFGGLIATARKKKFSKTAQASTQLPKLESPKSQSGQTPPPATSDKNETVSGSGAAHKEKKTPPFTWRSAIYMALLVSAFGSVTPLIWPEINRLAQSSFAERADVESFRTQITNLSQQLSDLERRDAAAQASLVDRKLSQYLTKTESGRFLTIDEAEKRFVTKQHP